MKKTEYVNGKNMIEMYGAPVTPDVYNKKFYKIAPGLKYGDRILLKEIISENKPQINDHDTRMNRSPKAIIPNIPQPNFNGTRKKHKPPWFNPPRIK